MIMIKMTCFIVVVKMVRKDMLQHTNSLNDDFDNQSKCESVSSSLFAIVNVMLYGANIVANEVVTQPCLTIPQLLCFNVQIRKPTGNILIQQTDRESHLPSYMGLSIFGKTWKEEIVEKIHSLALLISYTCMLKLSADMCEIVNIKFQKEKAVHPPKLRQRIFIITAYDNIHQNPSSSPSENSFHIILSKSNT